MVCIIIIKQLPHRCRRHPMSRNNQSSSSSSSTAPPPSIERICSLVKRPILNFEGAVRHSEEFKNVLDSIVNPNIEYLNEITTKTLFTTANTRPIPWDNMTAQQQSFFSNPCRWLSDYRCILGAIRTVIDSNDHIDLTDLCRMIKKEIVKWTMSLEKRAL
jgi:hypothetical protein